jgi:hypothetical protein
MVNSQVSMVEEEVRQTILLPLLVGGKKVTKKTENPLTKPL